MKRPKSLLHSVLPAARALAMARGASLLATVVGSLLILTAARAEALRDPTQPTQARSVVALQISKTLRVEAVLSSKERTLAIINGKVVHVGDRIGKARIDEILDDGVRYTRDGRSRFARLDQPSLHVRSGAVLSKDGS